MPHTTSHFTSRDGFKLYEQQWLPEGDVKAAVVIVHGIAEHSGRYGHVAAHLNANGYAVYTYDQLGHGNSEGTRAYIESIDTLATDLEQVINRTRQKAPKTPLFVLGHSMGGQVLAHTLVTLQPKVDGALFSGAAIKAGADIKPIEITVAKVLSRVLPKMNVSKLSSDSISRDPAVVADYDADPLNYRGSLASRTGAEMLRAMDVISAGMSNITAPILVMHGTGDKITNVEGSMQLHARAGSADKTLKLYDGLYHEILNEPEKETVLADIVGWLDEKVEGLVSAEKASHHKKRAKRKEGY